MIKLKSPQEIEVLREGGKRLATLVAFLVDQVQPGTTTIALDAIAREKIQEQGDIAAFLEYQPSGADTPYPAAVCISVNKEIVHGIPSDYVLQEGDVVTIDCGLNHKGMFTDHAITTIVGNADAKIGELVRVTKQALQVGLEAMRPGGTTADIGSAIEKFVDGRYGIVRDLSGHGVGYDVHEAPFVPNFSAPSEGIALQPGLVIAVEPMLTLGTHKVRVMPDGHTFETKDGSISAHFEHTVAMTEHGPEILTKA